MMGWSAVPWLPLMVVTSVAGEYIWTGTDWKWQIPNGTYGTRDHPHLRDVLEGSGEEGYEDSDSYAYDVKPNVSIPTFGYGDEEDYNAEGSGAVGGERVMVTTTKTRRKHNDAKPTETPGIDRVPPTQNNVKVI